MKSLIVRGALVLFTPCVVYRTSGSDVNLCEILDSLFTASNYIWVSVSHSVPTTRSIVTGIHDSMIPFNMKPVWASHVTWSGSSSQ